MCSKSDSHFRFDVKTIWVGGGRGRGFECDHSKIIRLFTLTSCNFSSYDFSVRIWIMIKLELIVFSIHCNCLPDETILDPRPKLSLELEVATIEFSQIPSKPANIPS